MHNPLDQLTVPLGDAIPAFCVATLKNWWAAMVNCTKTGGKAALPTPLVMTALVSLYHSGLASPKS